jgi:hypothetical protein
MLQHAAHTDTQHFSYRKKIIIFQIVDMFPKYNLAKGIPVNNSM